MRSPLPQRGHVGHSLRVAAVAALLIAVVYVLLITTFDLINAKHLLGQVDSHLVDSLADARHRGEATARPGGVHEHVDVDVAPVILWRVDGAGHPEKLSDVAPSLPTHAWSKSGLPVTATLTSGSFRLLAARVNGSGSWIVAGQSLAETSHIEGVLIRAELLAGPVLVVAMFLGAFVIGLKASGPVEQARLRQLEFTADASHELRTPLSVIEAEVALALDTSRDTDSYRHTLRRIRGESGRLRRIVEDLLWLARFDSEPPTPRDEPIDLVTIAMSCADRFSSVASSKDVDLSIEKDRGPALISAPPDWIDRLIGVLLDNACRVAGSGGTVRIAVSADAGRVSFAVEDSGPGIPRAERPLLFDRFHRATYEGDGAGLGLAIADAVVRSTGGRWRIGTSAAGGARMEVSWRSVFSRDQASAKPEPETVPPTSDLR